MVIRCILPDEVYAGSVKDSCGHYITAIFEMDPKVRDLIRYQQAYCACKSDHKPKHLFSLSLCAKKYDAQDQGEERGECIEHSGEGRGDTGFRCGKKKCRNEISAKPDGKELGPVFRIGPFYVFEGEGDDEKKSNEHPECCHLCGRKCFQPPFHEDERTAPDQR